MDHPISNSLFIELLEFRINAASYRAIARNMISQMKDERAKKIAMIQVELALNKSDIKKLDDIYHRDHDLNGDY